MTELILTGMPCRWHPSLSKFVSGILPINVSIAVSGFHPNADAAYAAGVPYHTNHPSVQALIAAELPANHTHVDTMLQNPSRYPLPAWHASLESMMSRSSDGRGSLPKISISYDHPDVGAAYNRNEAVPTNHPSVHNLVRGHLPPNHPGIDAMMKNPSAYPIPAWHPALNDMVTRRSFWSPGLIFSLMGFVSLIIAYIARICFRDGWEGTRVSPTPEEKNTQSPAARDLERNAIAEKHVMHDRLPRRCLSTRQMHQGLKTHRVDDPAYYDYQEVAQHVPRSRVAKEVSTSRVHALWVRLTESRIRGSQWATGDALFAVLYILFNIIALFAATTYTLDRAFGSLAAANTMFLVIPAVGSPAIPFGNHRDSNLSSPIFRHETTC